MISGEGNGRQPSEGPKAKGPTPFTRTYQLKKSPEHWLYVVANCDLSYEFTIFENVQQALKELADRGFTAVEVLSCRKIAERGLDSGNFLNTKNISLLRYLLIIFYSKMIIIFD